MKSRPDDPLIDALLEETLGGVTPPDLSARILKAWDERHMAGNGNVAPPLNVFAEVSEPLPPPIVIGTIKIARDAEVVRGDSRRRGQGKPNWLPLQLWASLGAVAAVLLIGFIGMRESNQFGPGVAQPDHRG